MEGTGLGEYIGEMFICPVCGYEEESKTNSARNVKRRGMEEEVIEAAVWINSGAEPGFYREDQSGRL